MEIISYYYQQPGDAKKPYLAQYSAVVSEDAPVNASYTILTNINSYYYLIIFTITNLAS